MYDEAAELLTRIFEDCIKLKNSTDPREIFQLHANVGADVGNLARYAYEQVIKTSGHGDASQLHDTYVRALGGD